MTIYASLIIKIKDIFSILSSATHKKLVKIVLTVTNVNHAISTYMFLKLMGFFKEYVGLLINLLFNSIFDTNIYLIMFLFQFQYVMVADKSIDLKY